MIVTCACAMREHEGRRLPFGRRIESMHEWILRPAERQPAYNHAAVRLVVPRLLFGVAAGVLSAGSTTVLTQRSCEQLAGLALPHTSITSAVMVPAGPLSGQPTGGAANASATVPARCEVKGVIRPTTDSEIRFAVWLPVADWNGKLRQDGNGGWAGAIPYRSMVDPLRRGYATAATDDGHEGGTGAAWAVGHPEKLIDFGYRAVT